VTAALGADLFAILLSDPEILRQVTGVLRIQQDDWHSLFWIRWSSSVGSDDCISPVRYEASYLAESALTNIM
jgi:hypothetical protein